MKHILTIFGLLLLLSALMVACGGGVDYDVDDDGINAPGVADDDDDDDNDAGDDDIDDDDDTGDDDIEPFNPDSFGIKFYDVGLGDAALVEMPGPYTMLIDGGETGQGQFTICPDLEARGIERGFVGEARGPETGFAAGPDGGRGALGRDGGDRAGFGTESDDARRRAESRAFGESKGERKSQAQPKVLFVHEVSSMDE